MAVCRVRAVNIQGIYWMKEIFVTQEAFNKKARLPVGSILYSVRLALVVLVTPVIAIEPHTFQGYGYSGVDYILLFIPFFISIILLALLFRRSRHFLNCLYLLFGYNTGLLIATLTPFFYEENIVLPFLFAIDLAMVIYMCRSVRAALFYRHREINVVENREEAQ